MAKAVCLWILCWDSRSPQELAADAMVLEKIGLLVGGNDVKKLKHKNSQFPKSFLGSGFKYFLFSPLLGEDSHFDLIFFNGVETTNQLCLVGVQHERSHDRLEEST